MRRIGRSPKGLLGLGSLAISLALSSPASASLEEGPDVAERPALVVPEAKPTTQFSAIFDIALVPLGKIGGRLELALSPLHAVYIEPSYIVRYIPDLERSISATEIDLGWHIFPRNQGLRGFYFGPRVVFAATSAPEAKAQAWGFGGDIGYQWVFRGGPAINIGAGIAYFHVTAQARPDAISIWQFLEPTYQRAITNATIHASGLMPLGMAGLGFAY